MSQLELTAPAEFYSGVIQRPPPPGPGEKKNKPANYRLLTILLLVSSAGGYLVARCAQELFVRIPGPKWHVLAALAGSAAAWPVAVGFHELGHVVGGWLVAGRFLLWQAGPLMVRRTPAGLRCGWDGSASFWGGMAACVPLPPAQFTPGRAACMIAGGPLASLLLALLALAFAPGPALAGTSLPILAPLAHNLLVVLALISFMLFLLTALPATAAGFKSDGRRLFDLLRGGPASAQEAALLLLTAASMGGVRPADYDPKAVAQALSLKDGSLFDRYGHVAVYYYAADRGDWRAAQAHLDYALTGADQIAPMMREILYCEYAWLLATHTGAAADARAWLNAAGKCTFDPASRSRAEAAILLAEGQPAAALAKAREALRQLEQRSLSPVKSPFALAALESIIAQSQP